MQISAPSLQTLLGFYERHGRRLPVLAAAVFALLVGSSLAHLVWTLVPTPEAARWQPPPVQATATRRSTAVDPAAVLNAHLFGRFQAEVPVTRVMEAPETPLNLSLMGVFASTVERESRALIAAQGGDERPYAIGDDVSRGVVLQAIFPDRVILSRNGRLETLRLERDRPTAGGPALPSPAVAVAPALNPAQQLAQIREEVLSDPAKASDYVRVQPANVGGQLRGYRIYPGRDRTVFSAAGLRPGDLVTSVNGVQLDDPARALQLLTELSQAGQVTLVVERGGQSQTISVNLN
jgi:general secretion pathway protein C